MAFENFFKRDRDRYASERDEHRSGSRPQWRDENRGNENLDRGYGLGAQGNDQRRGWRQGSDYYGNRDERFGRGSQGQEFSGQRGYGDRDYGGESWRGGQYRQGEQWRDEGQSYGSDYDRSRGTFGRDYGSSSDYGVGNEGSRGEFGSGGYGRDMDYGRRGAFGYGGYGGMGGAETGSSAYGAQEQFRGRGPRGYRRSDERIREDICDVLTDDPYLDASNIEVTVKECEITLSGTVNSREDKRRAEDLVEGISGVRDVHNTIRVASQQSSTGAGEQRGAINEGQQVTSGQTSTGQTSTGQTSKH
jgi:hypothetical protein